MERISHSGTLKGTKIVCGKEASDRSELIQSFKEHCVCFGAEEIVVPSLEMYDVFSDKVGKENLAMMYDFFDQGERHLVLRPEVTASIQLLWKEHFSKSKPKPWQCFYSAECFRGERPSKGRCRQFTQLGYERFGDPAFNTLGVAKSFLIKHQIDFEVISDVDRGLEYYDGNTFEIHVEALGSASQICGGGSYEGGCGFAFGLDRLLMAKS